MKKTVLIAMSLMSLLWLSGCVKDTFSSESTVTPAEATPRNLVYANVYNAREFSLITTNQPSVETGGLIPTFEVVAVYDANGNALGEDYMNLVSVANPVIKDISDPNKDPGPLDVVNYRDVGKITIKENDKYKNGQYSFDIKVSTELEGKSYSTTFSKGLKVYVGPMLPSLLYVPMGQNLVVGSGTAKTTAAYLPTGNKAVRYELGSDSEKLKIDPQTGVITLQSGYAPTEQVTVTPTIKVISTITEEVVTFEGSANLLTIVISTTPVTMPLQTKYFFTPTFASDNLTSGYKKYVINLGSLAENSKSWVAGGASAVAAFDRPGTLTGNFSILNNVTTGTNLPHESWIVMLPQNLSNYSYGFEVKATFWVLNQYVNYLSVSGLSPSMLDIMVSTNYNTTMSSVTAATWVDVTSQVNSQIYNNNSTPFNSSFSGLPYPGNNALVSVNGSKDNDQGAPFKDVVKNSDAKWTKCTLDLSPWKDATSFTIAFHHRSQYEGPLVYASPYDRPGRFQISDVYYMAKEVAGN